MSEIDSYRRRCLGIVDCPSRFSLIAGSLRSGEPQPGLPVYRLDKHADDAISFQGKAGDILLGGGSGEHLVLQIAIPEAFFVFTDTKWLENHFEMWGAVVRAYWTMIDAYRFGDGYMRRGWTPAAPIEHWLARHILRFLVDTHPMNYRQLLGTELLGEDGSICRLPTDTERTIWESSE